MGVKGLTRAEGWRQGESPRKSFIDLLLMCCPLGSRSHVCPAPKRLPFDLSGPYLVTFWTELYSPMPDFCIYCYRCRIFLGFQAMYSDVVQEALEITAGG